MLKKMDTDLQKIVTSADIAKFSESQNAKDAISVLDVASHSKEITIAKQDYILVRDYLMCETILRNANRPGVLASITAKQIRDAKTVSDHCSVHCVPRHIQYCTDG